jgi:uncharacterized protein (DUF433 family)
MITKERRREFLTLSPEKKTDIIQLLTLSPEEKTEIIQILDGINKTPNVVGGNARIRNTRIPVWSLVQSHEMGASELEILEAHPELTQTDLENAWVYAETFPDEIANAIAANESD